MLKKKKHQHLFKPARKQQDGFPIRPDKSTPQVYTSTHSSEIRETSTSSVCLQLFVLVCLTHTALSHMPRMTEVTQQLAAIQMSPADPSWIVAHMELRSSSLHLQTAAAGVSFPAHCPHVLHINNAAAADLQVCAMLTGSQCFLWLLERSGNECVHVCEESEVMRYLSDIRSSFYWFLLTCCLVRVTASSHQQ